MFKRKSGKGGAAAGWNNFVLITAAAHFALAFTLNTNPFLSFAEFREGRLHTPFQLRALTFWIMMLADKLVHIPPALAAHLPPRMNSVESFTLLGICFVSLVVAVYATRRSLEQLTGDYEASRWWALLVIFMAYFHYLLDFGHPCCTPLQLPYDLPSVAFFAVALMLMIEGRTAWLFVCFAFATLNRESSIFLVVIYLLYRSETRASRRMLALHAAGMLGVWIAIRIGLHHVYPLAAARAGSYAGFEIHVKDNLSYLFKPYYWASFLSMFGFTWIYLYRHWAEVPDAGIRRAMWIGPIMLVAMYVVGVLSEIRIFGELISLMAIAVALLLQRKLPISRGG